MRGQTAIIGIGELPTRRTYPGRSMYGLCAEVARIAIADAGLSKGDIDGLVVEGGNTTPASMADYLQIRPTYSVGVSMQGASSTTAVTTAAAAVNAGLCNYALIVMGSARDDRPERAPGSRPPGGGGAGSVGAEFEQPFGPAQGAGTGYALMYRRHMYEYGTTPEQMAKLAVDQRFNALKNPNSAFQGVPITIDDVLNSRYVNEPLHLLECVMPAAGAAACVITSADRARSAPNKPVYILGAGLEQANAQIWETDKITTTPARVSARRAYQMAGYGPRDIQFAQFYDCYTILIAMTVEDAGLAPKGEVGPFYESTDTTYKGTFPINTDGGQISCGQPGLAGGFRHVIEAARQIMGRAGERQVVKNDLCLVNG
ncbi:MAG TPA: thiolase family protein [Dehalococcoidia bacterium]|nr:thiolase family protein [Dehalococcoidia bacterium]